MDHPSISITHISLLGDPESGIDRGGREVSDAYKKGWVCH